MIGVSFVGAGAAEVYVIRKGHKETMKKLKKQKAAEIAGIKVADDEKKISGGSFFWLPKKRHSAKVSYADCDRKLRVEENRDSKG